MPGSRTQQFNDAAEMLLFSHYLRTGERFFGEAKARFLEWKFNPNHDPDDGRFTFEPDGGSLASRPAAPTTRSPPSGATRTTTHRPAQSPMPPSKVPTTPTQPVGRPSRDPAASGQRNIGMLAAKYESRRLEGPGTISSGVGEPGGVSYGTFQLSSTRRRVHDFMESPEARQWAGQFRGKVPVTREFDEQWQAVAQSDPAGFEFAQRAFVVRTNYSEGAEIVRRDARYDLERSSSAVRLAFFSTAVQHGPTGGGELLVKSVKRVDEQISRSDPRYESALVNALYDSRTDQRRNFAIFTRRRADLLDKQGSLSEATNLRRKAALADNDVTKRYPRERYDALLLLSGQPMSGL